MPEGIIIKGIGGFYEVYVPTEDRIHTCRARGLFRKDGDVPHAGDRVTIGEGGHEGSVLAIHERKNVLVRPPIANVDQLAIVVSATVPEPDPAMLDRMLSDAVQMNIRPILLLNKTDTDPEGKRLRELERIYGPAGFPVLAVCAKSGLGIERFEACLAGHITALAGQSGVGKSTILNAVMKDARMEIGDLSRKVQRGRHTTRHVELIRVGTDGYICDTPGFSHYETIGLSHDTLDQTFPEFADVLGTCRFAGCSHVSEPDCAVKQVVEQGGASPERYAGYCAMYRDLREEYQNRYRRK